MATTVANLQERLAFRLGEDSTPNDTNEYARRLSFINEGYMKIIGEEFWWFLQTVGSQTSVVGQEIYTLDADFRELIELRVDDKVSLSVPLHEATATYNYPPLTVQYGSNVQRHFVFGDAELHLIPLSATAPSTVTVTATQTSGVATLTKSAHGYSVNQYVTISGANESGYNGTFRITSVPTVDTFTIAVDSATSSPATGTVSCVKRNIVYRYWQRPVRLTVSTDTVLVPDLYSDSLVAYAYFRKMSAVEGMRGQAADAVEEYNEITKDMRFENNRKKFYYKGVVPTSFNNTIEI
jgi:hypothetical protein